MPTFKLDDREIPFEPGDTIIQAARRVGVDIPHYCWHPGLSVAANCRMCLVEIAPPPGRPALLLNVLEWDPDKQAYADARKPKLQPACQQPVSEGMEVLSDTSQHVTQARSAVQEMLLLNHPVDCPICDQAGECRLQDYWLEHDGRAKAMRDEPVHKPKAVSFGPQIIYDAERCIVCTRCVRVSAEVANDPVLSVRERGNLNEIVVAPGRQLDHAYSLMTEHVCPVGALTAKDFRFKARVWFLRSARTVCQGCATGCNAFLDFDPRDQTVHRHRPRENPSVNRYWMCDEGMLSYQRVHQGRLSQARIARKPARLGKALDEAAKLVRAAAADSVAVVLSAQHSTEDNFALLRLARDFIGTGHLFMGGKADGEGDAILRHTDKNPNRAGVLALCTTTPPGDLQALATGVSAGRFKVVLALGGDAGSLSDLSPFSDDLGALVVFGTHTGGLTEHASVALPASTWAEADGTFVNAKGVVQESEKAVSAQGESRPAWKLVGALGVRLGHATAWKRLEDIRSAMKPDAGAALGGDSAPAIEAGA